MQMGGFAKDEKTRWCYLALVAFMILLSVTLVVLDHLEPGGRRVARIDGLDPPYYFANSHSMLFDHDSDLMNELARVPASQGPWIFKGTGLPETRWPIGYSILSMPFLGAGTVLDALVGNPADGYSNYAILGYTLSNTILTGLGLIALFTFLNGLGSLWGVSSPAYALIATLAVFFGTTVGFYSFSNMSHASTVFASSLFLACWWKVRESTDVKGWLLLGIVGGLLSICRIQEVYFVGAPFLFDIADREFFRKFRPWFFSRIAYVSAAALCWVPQVLQWKIIYGKFITNPYGEAMVRYKSQYHTDWMHFPPPYIPNVLFSSINGWFIWTPLCFLGVCGLIYGLFRFGRVYFPWLFVIALQVALIASTEDWNGADSFGARYLTSSTTLVGMGLVTILYATKHWKSWAVVGLATAFCLFTSLFAVQFRLDLIPRIERLTPAEVFTDKLRILQVIRQKQAVREASTVLQSAPQKAVEILERAAAEYGEGRSVLTALGEAYRTNGQQKEAESADRRLDRLMQSRMW
jgi:hypothetical protein